MNRDLKTWLWGFIFGMVFMGVLDEARADAIASMPNKGGGKIVLTNEICKLENKTYESLRRAYNYTSEGYGSEGCYAIEDETVIVIWKGSDGKPVRMRYGADNFTILKKTSTYGT